MTHPKPVGESRGKLKELTEESRGERHTGITIFDKSEPRSVYNLVTPEVQAAIDRVHPTIWNYSFGNLEKHAKADATLAQLRVSFWHQYNETQDKFKDRIPLTTVMQGICVRTTFYKYLSDQFKCAYIFYPTVDYIAAMAEMQDLALREMRKILKMPNAGNKGANMPVIREKIKIFALLENRLRGSVPRRLEAYHAHQHTLGEPPIKDVTTLVGHQKAPQSLKDIESELRRIDKTVDARVKESLENSADSPGTHGTEGPMAREEVPSE